MKKQFVTILSVLLLIATQVWAQALAERYNEKRPAVIVSDNYQHSDLAKLIATNLGINCIFHKMTERDANIAFSQGEADVIITAVDSGSTARIASKSILGYTNLNAATFAPIRFVGKDHQLIEQIDDQYMRLKQSGELADLQERWEYPELTTEQDDEAIALEISDILLVISVLLIVVSLVTLWHIRRTRLHTKEVNEMISQTKHMSNYYEIEDNQAAHDLTHKYEAILYNPYLAIAFYGNNGQLIVENDTMKRLGNVQNIPQRQPLYNANGEVTNYITAFVPPTT